MRSKISKFIITALLGLVMWQPAWAQVCDPSLCVFEAQCSSSMEDVAAFTSIDKGIVEAIRAASVAVMQAINSADMKIAKAVMTYSAVRTNLSSDLSASMIKTAEVVQAQRQAMRRDKKALEARQFAEPSSNLRRETKLKLAWPMSEALTRGIRQQLYSDHVQRVELEHEDFYTDKTNLQDNLSYNKGTIAGIAKLYHTHKDFFCNAAGAQKPAGCSDKAANTAMKMGDQMLEIYLGDGTWPKQQVQKAIELMQFYLGISPPDLINTADFGTSEGQRAYLAYQGKLAKNNFLTYIMSYLVAKRAPTTTNQIDIVAIRKEAAGCKDKTAANQKICDYLDNLVARTEGKASRAELSKALEYDQYMNPAYVGATVSGTMGIEKDLAMMMVDRLQQDYEEYQMDKMITASMAGYYASQVPAQ